MQEEAIRKIGVEVSKLSSAIDIIGQGQFQEFNANRTSTTNQVNDLTLINLLSQSPVIRNASVYRDVADGEYKVRPYVTVSNQLLDDDGSTCCVEGPGFGFCQHTTPLRYYCVKSCIEDTMDVIMKDVAIVGGNDIQTPYKSEGDSLADVQTKKLATDYQFYFARNIILGSLAASGGGLRPFYGLAEAMTNSAVASFTGSAGISRAIASIQCRLDTLGSNGNWIMVGNKVTLTSIVRQLEATSGTTLPNGWTVTNGLPNYNGIQSVPSVFMPVDLNLGLGEIVLIDLNKVGLMTVYNFGQPKVIDDTTTSNTPPNCLGECMYLYNAGGIVVSDYNGIIRIPNIAIDSACRLGLSGLEGFVNPTVPFPAQG